MDDQSGDTGSSTKSKSAIDQGAKSTVTGINSSRFSQQGFTHPFSNKLDDHNYLTWRKQVQATIKGRFDPTLTATTLAQSQTQFNNNISTSSAPVEALIATLETIYDAAWYPDSGASNHITNDASNLQTQQAYTGTDKVHSASGSGLTISTIGQSDVFTASNKILSLKILFHVLAVTKNLLSVSKCAKDIDVYFVSTADTCVVKSQATHQVLLKGRMSNGLYLFDELPLTHKSNKTFSAHVICTSSDSSLNTWHCKSCSFSFPVSDSVYAIPLDLVYSDVWGPTPILSSKGYRYYVIFIDACTRYTSLYLLKAKSDTLLAFKQFKALAENQFNTSTKSFQSDFGAELRSFIPFLNQHGISHRLSCPHTHQQNGSAERKHRHITEIGLTLLANASLPLYFWDEAFLTSLATALSHFGFTSAKCDSSLFIRRSSHSVMFILVYVDDVIITGSSLQEIQTLISSLHAQFALKDMGSLHYFLSLQVLPTTDHGLVLTQTKYITDLLSRAGLTDAKPQKMPMVSGLKFHAGGDEPFSDATLYGSIVGALQYTALTRPEIAYSVNKVCQFMHNL
ncbi:Retrovirus-related Pol polyprotein from transposon TNT 1-94 [Senna tora]|uniref:Retrovirus-related Pol polyprotein from transposon TNT 1-94 n=1 Tax=Senna tora TaxID=362788 RepID=A0A834WRK2_9FABA|nr:Retrovirus-related Pol polyprotein from transposon TNT 1-94 [Senna tora]